MAHTETTYLLSRAEEEAIAAIRADHPSVSASHQQLSLLYSARALLELSDSDDHQSEIAGVS